MPLTLQDRAIHAGLRSVVDAALIAEHRAAPFGPHSLGLVRVLDFLRRNPDPDRPRYLVLDEGSGGYGVAIRPVERDGEPLRADDERFGDRDSAEHGVFLRRLRDYGLVP